MARRITNINPERFEKSQIKIYAYIIPIAIIMGLPIIFIFNHAFKPLNELFAYPPTFFVKHPTTENFSGIAETTAASDVHISRYVFNSIFVSVVVIALSIWISTLGAFALSKMKFRGKEALLNINNLALMFVPVTVSIPRYLVIQFIGIQDTYLAHILPILAMPVGIFLVKQFIDQLPDALIEAALIDGASYTTVYRKIVLPLIRPSVATLAILSFQTVWNNIESSAMYVDSENMRTLAFYMNTLSNNANLVAGQGLAAASSLIMFVPNIVLFIVMQSRVMNTMAQSGIK